jgi:type II secretory pathway component GspD/PulD (secretin)
MRARQVQFAVAILFAAVAFGQTQGQTPGQNADRVFQFTYTQAPQGLKEITTAISGAAELTQASLNADAKTLTVGGTPDQIAIAAWLFSALDQPAPPNQATQEYSPAGSVNDAIRIYYVTHIQGPQNFQEMVNAVRLIPQIPKVFPYFAQGALVVRTTDSQAAMTAWLFHQLDVPAGVQPVQNPSARPYASPGAANDEVQVLFLTHSMSPQSMQQIVNTLRVIPQLTKVFPSTATGAVSVRGPTATVALAAWLFSQLDQAPQASSPPPQQFQMPGGADDVTQVFYLTPATTAEAVKSIVAAVRSTVTPTVFPDEMFNAVTLRGTAAQIASADLLIKRMNNP